jgi:hypothetical protein
MDVKIFAIGILIVAVLLIGIGYSTYPTKINNSLEVSQQSNCAGLDLQDTSYCLQERLRPYFNYILMGDNNRTVQEILLEGGDCYDYTRVYEQWAKELNITSQRIQYIIDSENGHIFLMIHDKTGYCILDQLSVVKCFVGKQP